MNSPGYGWLDDVNYTGNTDDRILMRFRNQWPPFPIPRAFAQFMWKYAGSDKYVDGSVRFPNTNLKNRSWHQVSVPMGWNGPIDRLRVDPVPAPLITSTVPAGLYAREQGTSMAAPAVTGTVTLMLQQFIKTFGADLVKNPPFPSTIKAILVETAHDLIHETPGPWDQFSVNPDTLTPVLYFAGPDFATGYGLVDAGAAIDLIRRGHSYIHESELEEGMEIYEVWVDPAQVSDGSAIKVTLAWDDVEGNPELRSDIPQLVNDLDLVLVDPNGNSHYPWTLAPLPVADCGGNGPGCGDPDPIKPTDIVAAVKAPDHRNNVEKAEVSASEGIVPGTWKILVLGTDIRDVRDGAQSYSLVSNIPFIQITDGYPWKKARRYGVNVDSAPALIQSTLTTGGHGAFEIVLRQGDQLCHYWRDNSTRRHPWYGPTACFGSNITSAPTLIQSTPTGSGYGAFEVVVRQGDQLCHYWRDNSTAEQRWYGPTACFGANITSAPALIQSTLTAGGYGPFEVVVRQGDQLCHYWRDNSTAEQRWYGPTACFGANITSAPALIQSTPTGSGYGAFEVVVRQGDQLCHYWRDNSKAGFPWDGPTACFSEPVTSTPALIQSNFIEPGSNQGNFEVVVRDGGQLCHYRRNNGDFRNGFPWEKSTCYGNHVNSAPALIQSDLGIRGNFEVVVKEGNQFTYYWRNNDDVGISRRAE